MLYVPGNDAHKLAKLESLSGAAFILDLEDAVARSEKPQARVRVADFVSGHGGAHELFVRVNAADTEYFREDLEAVARPGLSGVVLPKVQGSADIARADGILSSREAEIGLPLGSIPLMAIIETALGVHHLDEIASASARLRVLSFGAGDFSRDLGIGWPLPDGRTSPALTAARTAVVVVSRARGLLSPHDGVYPIVHDADGLRREALAAREMGFSGKHVIHPSHVPVVNMAFAPTDAEVAWARKVSEAFGRSEAAGEAAIVVDGQFVDYPVAARARQILDLAGPER